MRWFLRMLAAVGVGIAGSVLIGALVFRLSIRGLSLPIEPFDAFVLVHGLPTALVGLLAYRVAGRLLHRAGRPTVDDR